MGQEVVAETVVEETGFEEVSGLEFDDASNSREVPAVPLLRRRRWPAVVAVAALGLAGCTAVPESGATGGGPQTFPAATPPAATAPAATAATAAPTPTEALPTTLPPPEADGKLQEGEVGEAVKAMQARFRKVGCTTGGDKRIVDDGTFGPKTKNVVTAFEIVKGAKPIDGVFEIGGAVDQALAAAEAAGDITCGGTITGNQAAAPPVESDKADFEYLSFGKTVEAFGEFYVTERGSFQCNDLVSSDPSEYRLAGDTGGDGQKSMRVSFVATVIETCAVRLAKKEITGDKPIDVAAVCNGTPIDANGRPADLCTLVDYVDKNLVKPHHTVQVRYGQQP